MHILLDEAQLGWDQAWDLTRRTLAYTNHTLLPEALERWPFPLFEALLPRHLEIILEINRRLLDDVRTRFPGDEGRVARISLIGDGPERKVRMTNMAIAGSHSTNGVAAIHSELLRTRTVKDLAEMFPKRFNNKTNGVTPRRWLLLANPPLANTITKAIGDGWITDLTQLKQLQPLADDGNLRNDFRKAKRTAMARLADWLKATTGQLVDPETLFDCQVKRIHEYKRQLPNALRIVVLYNRLRANPDLEMAPRTFFLFGLTAQQVADSRGWYSPYWHYENEPETRAALELIFSNHFSRDEPGVFNPLRDTLLTGGDHYMHLADLRSYLEADQRLLQLYADPDGWARKAILNVAASGKFSSDRTIAEYATGIWNVEPCPVP
jgi:glucan phosphorylase